MTHDAERFCCFCCKPAQAVEHVVNIPVICDDMGFIYVIVMGVVLMQ